MNHVVVEVGPGTIRGPNMAAPELISLALDCIDDDLGLLDDRAVPIDDLWRDVFRTTVGNDVDDLVVVCPSWWHQSRIERVRAAALMVADSVDIRGRTAVLRDSVDEPDTTIVEVGQDFVVVTNLRGVLTVVARGDGADAVVSAVGVPTAALVDAPAGVAGAEVVAATIVRGLRAVDVGARIAHPDTPLRVDSVAPQSHPRTSPTRRPRIAVAAGIVAAVALCAGFAIRGDAPPGEMPMTVLVEGRVGVTVPATWSVRRITSGPGSARVQVVSPTDDEVIVNVTQSPDVPYPSVAEALRAALADQPAGVFTDFDPAGHRAGRAAATYRENREAHHVAWTVVVDGTVRIAIGCQTPPNREHLVRDVCDRAIASAHAIF